MKTNCILYIILLITIFCFFHCIEKSSRVTAGSLILTPASDKTFPKGQYKFRLNLSPICHIFEANFQGSSIDISECSDCYYDEVVSNCYVSLITIELQEIVIHGLGSQRDPITVTFMIDEELIYEEALDYMFIYIGSNREYDAIWESETIYREVSLPE